MIITNCPECGRPAFVDPGGGIFGTYVPVECPDCDCTMVVEVTRTGGKTYEQANFEENVLPDLDGFERIDHPSGEETIYADRDNIGIKNVD